MNIFYTENTLYVNLEDSVDDIMISRLKQKIFGILDDYDIENIVLNVIAQNNNCFLLDDFIKEYHAKYNGNIVVR
jgi:hypothetical protein